MRIAVVLGSFPSASQTFVLNQLTGLIDAGHEIDIFSADPGSDGRRVIHDDIDRYGLLERVHYWPDNVAETFVGLGRALKAIVSRPRSGLRTCARMLPVIARALRHPSCLPELSKAVACVDEPAHDLIYCHFGHIGLSACRLRILGALRGRLAIVFHGYDMSRLLRQRGDRLYAPLFREAELLLPISTFWRDRLIGLGADPLRCHVHHMAIDTHRFAYRPRRKCADGVTRIVTIARFVEKKGLPDALRAVAALVDRHPGEIEYHVVGSGGLEAELRAQVRAAGIEAAVRFHGSLKQGEVARLLERMHILLAPSATARDGDMEGIPVALMEAMAVGMPVVSTRHSGIPELVEDGLSGYLVEEHDVSALIERLEELLEEPESWLEMGRQGRRRVEKEFDLASCNEKLLEILQSLCDEESVALTHSSTPAE